MLLFDELRGNYVDVPTHMTSRTVLRRGGGGVMEGKVERCRRGK